MFGIGGETGQIGIFIALTVLIAVLTQWKVKRSRRGEVATADGSSKEVYLAGGGLSWLFVAGSITLTNLSTDQLVGMNGNQMLLLAWWEICGFFGLLILAFVFVPIYYKAKCTTVTELLERRYGHGSTLRTLVSAIFLFGLVFVYIPAPLYTGGLFLRAVMGSDASILWFAGFMGVVAAAYTVSGGLRAVAIMETYSGIGVLAMAVLVVVLALAAVGWDISDGVPVERLTMIGSIDSPIPIHTLFTGMLFIQIFYWSTNQPITQKAMTAPTVREAQKGVLAAAVVRIMIIPAIVVIPGVVAFQMFGDINDAAYGKVVAAVLPTWISGAFAAMIAAAVIAHTAAVLNAAVALYAVDIHEKYVAPVKDHWRLSTVMSIAFTIIAIALVPVFENTESIINRLQQLNGLTSMPVLSAFIVGLMFHDVDARAAIMGLLSGLVFYALHDFVLYPADGFWGVQNAYQSWGFGWLHYIDVMLVTLLLSVGVGLAANRFIFGNRAVFIWSAEGRRLKAATA